MVTYKSKQETLTANINERDFLYNQLSLAKQNPIQFKSFQAAFENQNLGNFQLFWFSNQIEILRSMGLLIV